MADGTHSVNLRLVRGAYEDYLLLLPLALAAYGCATSYQPNGFSGGFSETQLGENIFRVSFRGNGYTRGERASDFALLRSAEIAQEHGFSHFVVVQSADRESLSSYTTPTQSYTTGNAYAVGNTAYGSARTTTYGGQTHITSAPSTVNTIVCFKEKPQTNGLVFDAQFVQKSLKQKYGLP